MPKLSNQLEHYMIKYGIKIWSSNNELLRKVLSDYQKQLFDFLELYFVPNSLSRKKYQELSKKMPITLHAPHEIHHLNLALPKKTNQPLIVETLKIADLLKTPVIILHPGIGGTYQQLKTNLLKIQDKRFLLENMPVQELPKLGRLKCQGATYQEIEQMLLANFGLCLDFSHAIKSAFSQKISYKKFIAQLISKFSPIYFHLSNGKINNPYDEHNNLWEGEFDLKWIRNQLLKLSAQQTIYLVLETPKNKLNLANDIKNITYFKNL